MAQVSILCPTCCLNNTASGGIFLPVNYWFPPVGVGCFICLDLFIYFTNFHVEHMYT